MKINLLSDAHSRKNEAIQALAAEWRRHGHQVRCEHQAERIEPAEVTFILGFFQIVPSAVLARSRHNIVVHESRLPKGRGWSPINWSLLAGENAIHLTLFEAVDRVDAGTVYLRSKIPLKGHELLDEVQARAVQEMVRLCRSFIRGYPRWVRQGKPQRGRATYYPRRRPEDSRLDPHRTLAAQFNRLRAVDNDAYPAFFDWKGHRYILAIRKEARRQP